MDNIYKTYLHNPPHLFRDKTKYFITGSTYNKKRWFKSDAAKERLLKSFNIGFNKHGWLLEDWVILDNHYHLMGNSPKINNCLPEMMKNIHKHTAMWVKKNVHESINEEKIMYNYWDTCITYEVSYFARVNYIWNNPVKHGYAKNPEEWKFGSFFTRCKVKENNEEMDKIKTNYPCDKVSIDDDY